MLYDFYIHLKIIKEYSKSFDITKMYKMIYQTSIEKKFNYTIFFGLTYINSLENFYETNYFQYEKEIPFKDGFGLSTNFHYLKTGFINRLLFLIIIKEIIFYIFF